MSSSASRKIRFAPLPDPRRAVLVTEGGREFPSLASTRQEEAKSKSKSRHASEEVEVAELDLDSGPLARERVKVGSRKTALEAGWSSSLRESKHESSGSDESFEV